LPQTIGENPIFNSFKEEYLGCFNPTDSRIMIEEIGGLQDINWESDTADQVYNYCTAIACRN
jgi:hypothetical protein